MKLQRYDIEQDGFDINVSLIAKASDTGTWVKYSDVAELESAICETCKDPACEDSRLAYYVAKAMKAGERIGRLEMALADIAEGDCTCFEDDSCAACRAKKELRGGE
jgi:hypothetical protein